jgi:hypothetical protein
VPDNIHHGINSTDFMKMNFFRRASMDPGLGLGEAFKYGNTG